MKKTLLASLLLTISVMAFASFPAKGWSDTFTAKNSMPEFGIYEGQNIMISYTTDGIMQFSKGGPVGIFLSGSQFGTSGGYSQGYYFKSFNLNNNGQARVEVHSERKFVRLHYNGRIYLFAK